jgi:hypothetical protein
MPDAHVVAVHDGHDDAVEVVLRADAFGRDVFGCAVAREAVAEDAVGGEAEGKGAQQCCCLCHRVVY